MIQNSKNTLLLSNFEAVTCERDVKVLKAVSQKNLGKLFERKGDQNVNSTFDFTKQDISAPFFSYETLGCGARPVGHWVWLCETCDELLAWNVRLDRTAFERKSLNAQKRGVAKVWVGGRFWANETARPPAHHLNQRRSNHACEIRVPPP